jgi:hypothetical protein
MTADTIAPSAVQSWTTAPAPHGMADRLEQLDDGTWRMSRLLGGRLLGGRTVTPQEAAVWLVTSGQLGDADPPAALADEVAALEI